MQILVLNCGSSSVKSQVLETSPEQIREGTDRLLLKASADRIGFDDAMVTSAAADGRHSESTMPLRTMEDALRVILERVAAAGLQIQAVGHRVVHGGESFRQPVEITQEVAGKLDSLVQLAPLHVPHNLRGFRAAQAALPEARHVAVFDTGFHATLPPRAYFYGLPYSYYTENHFRRYGFHGISHRYIAWRYAEIHGGVPEDYKLVSCHLGNGASICAIDKGRSVDTSMGFTPVDGLLMGTRCGEIDPTLVLHIMAEHGKNPAEMEEMLNHDSGLLGLSGISSDMRTLLAHREQGDARAATAIDVFCYRVRKFIGAYIAILNGADAVVFTGGIGEHAAAVRAESCADLDVLGIEIDQEANAKTNGTEGRISSQRSRVAVWCIPTNEELLIARDTLRCLSGIPQA